MKKLNDDVSASRSIVVLSPRRTLLFYLSCFALPTKKKNKDEIFSLVPDSDKIITIVLEKEMLQLKAKEKYNRKIKGAFTLRQRNLKTQLYFNG